MGFVGFSQFLTRLTSRLKFIVTGNSILPNTTELLITRPAE